jgi:membrane-bound lytic murein transglycosylase D
MEAETFMRFIFSTLLVLMLAACASQGPTTSSNTTAPNPATQQAVADALRNTASAKETINVDQGSVDQLTSPDADLWARIRRGFQMPDLQSDLVDMQVNWYAQRPDYVARMTERSQKYPYADRARVAAVHRVRL